MPADNVRLSSNTAINMPHHWYKYTKSWRSHGHAKPRVADTRKTEIMFLDLSAERIIIWSCARLTAYGTCLEPTAKNVKASRQQLIET